MSQLGTTPTSSSASTTTGEAIRCVLLHESAAGNQFQNLHFSSSAIDADNVDDLITLDTSNPQDWSTDTTTSAAPTTYASTTMPTSVSMTASWSPLKARARRKPSHDASPAGQRGTGAGTTFTDHRQPLHPCTSKTPNAMTFGTVLYSVRPQGSRPLFPSIAIPQEPQFQLGSPEMLMTCFDKRTCGIMSVRDGPGENPWRTLIWPLTRDSKALYHAILSMSCFHSTPQAPQLRMHGIQHMRDSLRALCAGLATMPPETALATTLALAFAESWDQHIVTGINHIRGAKLLVDRLLADARHTPPPPAVRRRVQFLCRTWIYMDVISRITGVDDDYSDDFATVALAVADHPADAPPGIRSHPAEIDPLMGCAATLFPLVGRVANLVRRVCRSAHNTPDIITRGAELRAALERWSPPATARPSGESAAEVSHVRATAESYRCSTLLYLHQAVPELAASSPTPTSPSRELARRALANLAAVPLSSKSVILHIYPLLAAGCEATGVHRVWVSRRWQAMSRRMGIGNVDRCLEVVEEVWRRRDVAEVVRRVGRGGAGVGGDGRVVDVDSGVREGTLRQGASFGGVVDEEVVGDAGWQTEYTVRDPLHWVGVMKDWSWEGMYLVVVVVFTGKRLCGHACTDCPCSAPGLVAAG